MHMMMWLSLGLVTGLAASTAHSRVLGNEGALDILAGDDVADFECHLPPSLDPAKDGLPSADHLFSGKEALLKQVKRHGTLVKVPSVSYDDNGEPGEDPRWNVFYELHETLAALYPSVYNSRVLSHARSIRETVNTFGLVFTVDGSDASLRPLMLTAHQDVVPVADPSTWKYPPFSAHFDGRWLWGRGASDDKNSLTGIFSALESLLSNASWTPTRSIIIALGFDEECSGRRGAGTIAPFLEKRWGKDSVALLLDEGGMGLELIGGDTLYVLPAVTEKGHVDVWFDLTLDGGHSSKPLPHTGIGIASEIVVTLEANPFEPKLTKNSPTHKHFVCQAKYSPKAEPQITKMINEGDLESLAKKLASVDRETQFRLQTSQAVDIFTGGVKINALPERISVGVNYRIAPQNSIGEIKAKILHEIKPIVTKYGLSVIAFECEEQGLYLKVEPSFYDIKYNGTLLLRTSQLTATPPISPTSDDAIWDVFSGTIQHTFAFPGGRVVPVGELMTGNTDTRHYLNLTRNVYRWTPTRKGATQNAHTVDEAIDMHAHMDAVKFYYDLIRNFDASDTAKFDAITAADSEL